jgi:PBSX family phage portal protein
MARKNNDEPGLFRVQKMGSDEISPYDRMGIQPTSDDLYPRERVEKAADGTVDKGTQAIVEDPFRLDYDAYGVIRPPINMLELASLWEKNSILGQCVETMAINCEAFGHDFKPRFAKKDVTPDVVKRMDVEYSILTNFFKNVSVNEPHLSFTDLRIRKRVDQESTGGAWWEVIRGRDGEPMGFNHLAAHTCRWGKLTSEEVKTTQKIVFFNPDGSYEFRTRTVWRNFRLILQRRGIRLAWFKTLGDPRIINRHNGYIADETLPVEDRANEVVYFPNTWSPRTPYTFPRFAGCLFSIYGSRSTDEINYSTFENNMMPSMVILVSNGMLTQGSIARYKEFTEANIVGRKNYSTFLLLESEPVTEGVSNPGTMKLDVKPLVSSQDKNNRDKVRGCFRLPPIYLGAVQGYNKSTASISQKLADQQVFGPERSKFDEFMNNVILPELNILYWTFVSHTPDTTDNEDLIKLLVSAEKSGGSNPRIAREVMNQVFSRNLGPIQGIDPEVPYSLQLAQVMQAGAVPETKLSVPGENAVKRSGNLPGLEHFSKSAESVRLSRMKLEQMYDEMYKEWYQSAFGESEAEPEPPTDV